MDEDQEYLVANGLEDAFIGISYPWQAKQQPVAVYSYEKALDILMTRDGMSFEEAVEFFDFNIAGAYVGEQTPIYVKTATVAYEGDAN